MKKKNKAFTVRNEMIYVNSLKLINVNDSHPLTFSIQNNILKFQTSGGLVGVPLSYHSQVLKYIAYISEGYFSAFTVICNPILDL